MKLYLDVGNSSVKWMWDGQGVSGTQHVCQRPEEGSIGACLDELFAEGHEPTMVAMVSVAGRQVDRQLRSRLKDQWPDVRVRAFRSRKKCCGVKNGYADPAQLGDDRWAALVGARELTGRPCCIVDCGTAVTVDYLSGDGAHRGGLIMPGLEMMRRALQSGTAGVSLEGDGRPSLLAADTRSAVLGGTLYMLAAGVERVVDELAEAAPGEMELLLTGSGADELASLLSRPSQVVPDLVLRGVRRMEKAG